MKHKILLTGGHAGTTALAFIEELEKNGMFEISWIGSSKAVEGKKIKTLESRLLPNKNIDYHEINSGRLQKRFTRHTLLSLTKVPLGFLQAYSLVNKIDPDIVVSFGGYVSFPVVVASWIKGIPIVVHEQTIAAGLANKMASYFATKIALARTASDKYYGKQKTVWVGNPINPEILKIKRAATQNKKPILFVTGGSRGSQIINQVVFDSLSELTKKFKIIHQVGELDYEKAYSLRTMDYQPYDFLDIKQISEIYSKANYVISRAGANTVSELAYLKIPTLFIPIPWTRYDEQTKNALLAKRIGFAEVLHQDDLSEKILVDSLEKLSKKQITINSEEYKKVSKDEKATYNLLQVVLEILK